MDTIRMVSSEPRFELLSADSTTAANPDLSRLKLLAMDRRLVIIAGCGILLIAALIISLAVVASKSYDGSTNATCLTPGCTIEASRVLQALNQSVKPCDDFYEFACGGFEASTTTPDDGDAHSTLGAVNDKLQEQLRHIIEEPSRPDELKTFRLAKDLYRSCINSSANDKSALQKETLLKVLEDLGGWPILEGNNWKEDTFNWSKTIQKCWKLGYKGNYMISFNIDTDIKNNTKHILQLDQAAPILPRWTDQETTTAYFTLMLEHAINLGVNYETAFRELGESLKFEMTLAGISWSRAARRNVSALNNPMPISELNKRYPFLDWELMFNRILPPPVRVSTNDIVNVRVPSYLSKVEKIIGSTSKRTVANYILWKVVQSSYPGLTEEWDEDSQLVKAKGTQFIRKVSDLKSNETAQREKCVGVVAKYMPISMGALYARNHFKEDAKAKALQTFTGLRMEFKEILEKAEWMDQKTRTSALEKVASMQTHIAYPDEFLDDKKLEEFYADLELNPNNFLTNFLNLTNFQRKYDLGLLRKPVNRTDWITYGVAAVVNAYYDPRSNAIIVPAGILQEGMYSKDRPQYMNYGAIGYIVGHEITHGFDNTGSQFDKEGNSVDWWDPETRQKYDRKTQCLVRQYGNYTAEPGKLKLDGSKTLGENIADNGGIKLAYLAYKKLVKTNGAEPKLPGLIDYTPEQMFWISAGNTWCTKYGAQALETSMKSDGHSPGRFRVIGPFSNNPEFSADFNCPLGSLMNPVDKCSVW